jgi:hypothetical protein
MIVAESLLCAQQILANIWHFIVTESNLAVTIPLKLSQGAVQVRMTLVMKKKHLRSEVIYVADLITIYYITLHNLHIC